MSTIKPLYGSSSSLTVTSLKSLASDTNLLAGWSSAVIDNSTNLSVTEKISYQIKAGTTPTVSTNIFIYVWAALDDTPTPTYPDTITGSEGAKTITSTNVLNSGAFKLGAAITVDATTGRVYSGAFDVAALFGGHMPKRYGVFIVHNTVAALDASTQVIERSDVTQYQSV